MLFVSMYLNIISALIAVVATICLYVSRKFLFWRNLGVPYVKPLPFFGSLKDVMLQKLGIGFFLNNIYDTYKGLPYVGMFSYDQPSIVIRDLDLVKNILIKDADVFVDRIATIDETLDPIGSKILFVMKGHKWKYMRSKLTPTFSSGKMKVMFSLVDKCARELVDHLNEKITEAEPINVKNTISKFSMDTIASCAFGIDCNSLKDPNSEFVSTLNNIFSYSSLSGFLTFCAPQLIKIFRVSFFDPRVNPFIRTTVWGMVEYREKHGVVRKDFLDIIIDLRKKGMELSSEESNGKYKLDGDDFAAIAFNFLAAGFETSSTTICFALYELALHPEIQDRLRKETTEVLRKHNNEVTYDCIQEMKYLDMVISETLRKYPILPFLDRKCVRDYKIPGPSGKGTITIPAGTGIYIPLMAFHYDPEYFPDPEKFDPERFTDENKQNITNYSYLPFGEGPRFCIGMRFGLMQTKTGLIHIISNFEVEPCKETQVPLVYKPSFLLDAEKGVTLSFREVTKMNNNEQDYVF